MRIVPPNFVVITVFGLAVLVLALIGFGFDPFTRPLSDLPSVPGISADTLELAQGLCVVEGELTFNYRTRQVRSRLVSSANVYPEREEDFVGGVGELHDLLLEWRGGAYFLISDERFYELVPKARSFSNEVYSIDGDVFYRRRDNRFLLKMSPGPRVDMPAQGFQGTSPELLTVLEQWQEMEQASFRPISIAKFRELVSPVVSGAMGHLYHAPEQIEYRPSDNALRLSLEPGKWVPSADRIFEGTPTDLQRLLTQWKEEERATFRPIQLPSLPDVPKAVLDGEGRSFTYVSDVLYRPNDNVSLIRVRLQVSPVKGVELNLIGIDQLEHLTREIQLLEDARSRDIAPEVLKGGYDAIASIVASIRDIIKSPRDTLKNATEGVVAAWDYVNSKPDVKEDLGNFARSYYEHTLEQVAYDHGLDFSAIQLGRTKEWVAVLANSRLAGIAGTELLLLYFSWAKVSKAVRAGGRLDDVFPNSARLRAGREAAQKRRLEAQALRAPHIDKLASNIDFRPASAAVNARAYNTQIYRQMADLHDLEALGMSPQTAIRSAFQKKNLNRQLPEFYFDPDLSESQILRNFDEMKKLGLFEEDNLSLLRQGKAPTIRYGPFKGEPVEVDHIIPVSRRPELSANPANCQIVSAKENRSRGAKFIPEEKLLSDALDLHFKPSTPDFVSP